MIFTYKKLYSAQKGRCFYCDRRIKATPFDGNDNKNGFTRDHFIPYSNGHTLKNNVVLACRQCNNYKSDKIPCEFFINKFLNIYSTHFAKEFELSKEMKNWLDFGYILHELEYWVGDRTGLIR